MHVHTVTSTVSLLALSLSLSSLPLPSQVMSLDYPLPLPPYSDRDMFRYMTTDQLFVLVECLEESHKFACSFNCNHEQRVVLMKAGLLFCIDFNVCA